MIIYIDLIILSNLFVNYIFIKTIKIIFKERVNIPLLVTSLFISFLSMSLFFISSKYIYNLRYFIGILIGYVAFYKKDIKTLIIQIVIFYLLNISFIGALVIFHVNNIILLLICSIFISLLWFIDSFKKECSINNNNYRIKIKDKIYFGFVDSGNNTYCDDIPVVYLDSNNLDDNFEYYKCIKVFTINGYSKVDIYKGPLLYINKKHYIAYYSFVKSLGKKVILNKELGE